MDNGKSSGEDGHLDLLRIDAVRAGEGTADELAHLESCSDCAAALAELRAAASTLRRGVSAIAVPADVDAAILSRFREAARKEQRVVVFPAWRRWAVPAVGFAAAAAVALSLALPHLHKGSLPATAPSSSTLPAAHRSEPPTAGTPTADVNGDGVVDIRDALRLAKLESSGGGLSAAWDVNHDGRVDALDVEAVARQAVAL